MFREMDIVELVRDVDVAHRGMSGVVLVDEVGGACVVEVFEAPGDTLDVLFIPGDALRLVEPGEETRCRYASRGIDAASGTRGA